MSRPESTVELDDRGRPIHRMDRGQRQRTQPIERAYGNLWQTDKLDKPTFRELYKSLLIGKTTDVEIEEAAHLADLAYQQIMLREQGLLDR